MFALKTNDERTIRHMQYVAWPDHGVPDSPSQFLAFTERVRDARQRSTGSPPVVVHCSAGIGRTGVLVLMETAMCLMEAGQPVYPLSIVRTMREQRAMMIQNAVSLTISPLKQHTKKHMFLFAYRVNINSSARACILHTCRKPSRPNRGAQAHTHSHAKCPWPPSLL